MLRARCGSVLAGATRNSEFRGTRWRFVACRAFGTEQLNKLPTREEQLERLKSGEEFDVLVVGGGATGAYTCLDAASRGLKTVCLERGDFASETSSRSTKLIWAGIRYLGTSVASLLSFQTLRHPRQSWDNFLGEFNMVLGAHRERRLLLENQPHLTNWVGIAVPIENWVTWPPPMGHPLFCIAGVVLPLVFKFYDGLSGFTCPPSFVLSKRRAWDIFPQLDSQRMKYTQVFYEGMHNDARTCTSIALTAAGHGATIANYVEVIGLEKNDANDPDRVTGVVAKDHVDGQVFSVKSKSVIFAGGPFTDSLRGLEDKECKPAVTGAAGTHIVLPGYFSQDGYGLLDINTSDGRFLFFLPWQGATIVGTTDRKSNPESSPCPPEDEIQWILNEVKKYLSPDLRVRRSDVLSAWRGWRPLAVDPHAPPGAPPSRDHTISTNPKTKVVFITGGKWTTSREMAEDVVNRILKEHEFESQVGPCKTKEIKLVGGEGYTSSLYIELIQKYNISENTALHLARTYGSKAWEICRLTTPTKKMWPRFGVPLVEGYPFLESEIEYAVKEEYAQTVKDMLGLRMRLAYINSEAAKAAAPRVAEIMGETLNWTEDEKNTQLQEALEYLNEFGGPIPRRDQKQFTDLNALFNKLDYDSTGYIDEIEFRNAAKTLGFQVASEDELAKLFHRIPGAEVGRIYEDDFIKFWNENLHTDEVLQKLDSELKMSVEKLDHASGVMFG
uniref:glycerol-3-phosphate dehydrogenase n=1 Tax=Mucochytrium quahogii TaxID=96639 RepID=A0A7S2W247_9STRA|mmetsp:Transcript_6432/g.10137  ORF Transcript_6432/g.10137 Transcript_6432/m.10137 type:complete len:727 (+) Transcript_6432:277-2457(+)|eukprot:CAMPEP_0203752776 /NCGR_PEP_ID=MMETSP0098-20131031/6635_1 /ASSEMBLY_ACC=CAM_ASM_000208 /TAXON_ID=96639 /ORGANISM=" , Strain NY0313808BC1" /LENGTH=726 /DNA_ID=CAMNT_0050643081 /DNA_START=254 /DNA_END=2434 /DNA_ORIENTATION=+